MPTVTAFSTVDQSVNGTWTTASNVQADDGNLASTTIAAINTIVDREQRSYGFDALIPVGATINSVATEVQHMVSTAAGIAFLEHFVRLVTTNGTVSIDSAEPTTLTIRTASHTRPGGGVWKRADLLDAVFRTRIRARTGNNATSVTFSWDYIKVSVDYSPPVFFVGFVANISTFMNR